ncbi:MAG: hypothetical protein HY557_01905 [Euryarchaeota archaeon]|nr:hypothetical protein [Euryarchaeota archaeon]
MLADAPPCAVCGWQGEDDVCPRCGTVLLRGRAFCRTCGKLFEGLLAQCDLCGGTVEVPRTPPLSEAVERLARLPGVDRETATRLYARGFADPAEVLKLALPERAVRLGVHRTLARHVALGALKPKPRIRKAVPCPVCGTPRAIREACPACGARGEREPKPEEIERTFEAVAGEVYDLVADPDFREMPQEMREDILGAFEDAGFAVSLEGEYAEQFREWRARGFDTQELERLLREEGEEAFRAKFVRILRSQVLKRREGGRFRCPLCDVGLSAAAEACENCGAKFA